MLPKNAAENDVSPFVDFNACILYCYTYNVIIIIIIIITAVITITTTNSSSTCIVSTGCINSISISISITDVINNKDCIDILWFATCCTAAPVGLWPVSGLVRQCKTV